MLVDCSYSPHIINSVVDAALLNKVNQLGNASDLFNFGGGVEAKELGKNNTEPLYSASQCFQVRSTGLWYVDLKVFPF
jgi:hypothetical protein